MLRDPEFGEQLGEVARAVNEAIAVRAKLRAWGFNDAANETSEFVHLIEVIAQTIATMHDRIDTMRGIWDSVKADNKELCKEEVSRWRQRGQ